MRHPLFVLIFALGCGEAEEVEGSWLGFCDFDGDTVVVEIDISDAKYGIVEGSIWFAWQDDEWDGDVDGTVTDDVLELSLAVKFDGDVTWKGLLDGELDGDELYGPMTLSGGDFELVGDCMFEQD